MRSTLTAAALAFCLGATPVLAADGDMPDAWVTSKTKLSLVTTAGVRGTSVHVDTIDGEVTLYGKVETAAQKALAEKTAREVKGVKGVNNLLQVVAPTEDKSVARADKEINEQASKALKNDQALKDSNISIKSVDKGVVMMTGTAKTVSDHLRAVGLVDQVPGVKKVASQVTTPDYYGDDRYVFMGQTPASVKASANAVKNDLKTSATQAKSDAELKADELKAQAAVKNDEAMNSLSDTRITTAVKMRLLTAPDVPSTQINVDTSNGVVTLFGAVPTESLKAAAATEARKVDGVTLVENQLQVVPTAVKQSVAARDADIQRDVKQKFKDRAPLKDVTTEVKNGTVRLTGTVPSGWDELEALRLVRSVAGVKSVNDDLKVNYRPKTEDAPRAY